MTLPGPWSDLRGAYLDTHDLSRKVLTGARLENATLWGAKLSGADLSFADLAGADLSLSELAGARLTGTWVGTTPTLSLAKNADPREAITEGRTAWLAAWRALGDLMAGTCTEQDFVHRALELSAPVLHHRLGQFLGMRRHPHAAGPLLESAARAGRLAAARLRLAGCPSAEAQAMLRSWLDAGAPDTLRGLLGYHLTALGLPGAETELAAARAAGVEDPALDYAQAALYARAQRYTDAEAALQRAQRAAPHDHRISIALADLRLTFLHDPVGARAALASTLTDPPTSPEQRMAVLRLYATLEDEAAVRKTIDAMPEPHRSRTLTRAILDAPRGDPET